MKRIKIRKNGVVTNQAEESGFIHGQSIDEWLAQEIANGSFGKPERWVRVQQDGSVIGEDVALAIDTRTVSDPMGDYVELKFAADFSVVEEDMTVELEQKKAKEDRAALIHDQLKALKKSDIKTIQDCADAIAKIIEHLRL